MDENDSIQNLCRICASNPPDVRNMFEVVYKEKLLSDILGQCLQCTIYRTEYFPEYICSQCCADLIKMYKFITNYENNEKWFISRYNAINEARIIKTETVCPTEIEQNPEISVEPQHQIFVESLANVVPIQDPQPNPLELKEEFDYDYEFEMAEMPFSLNGSNFEIKQLNEVNCHEKDNASAAYCNGINVDTVRKTTQKKEMIHHKKETGQYQCSICSKQFSELNNLRKHENLHTGTKIFKCYFCDETFRRSDYRVKHIRKMHPEIVFECFICKIKLNTFYDLCQHMLEGFHGRLPKNESNSLTKVYRKRDRTREKTKSRPHQCSICSQQFTAADNLRKHENLHTGIKIFKCYFCDETFRRSDYRVRHIRKMHPEVIFECSTCQLTFNTYNELGQHVLKHGHSTQCQNESNPAIEIPWTKDIIQHEKEIEQYQCSMCTKQFSNPTNLRIHENLHTGTKTFECYFCDETFRRSDYRVNHIRKIHSEIVYECFVCKITFDLHYDLCQHMLQRCHDTLSKNLHTHQRHICEVCGMSFSMKYRLIDHQLKHTDEKQFKCTHEDCQRAFKRKPELQDHLKIHEGKIEHFCECGEGFVLARQLRRHQVIHSPEEKKIVATQCSLCPKVFTLKRYLKEHMDRHAGKMYQCKYCELKLSSRTGREKHQRNMHEAPKSYECFDCKRIFKYYLDLFRHMEIHLSNGRLTFECEICFKPFWTEHQFLNHKRKHRAQVFDCEYCNESFEKKFELHCHVREMHTEKLEQYKCDQCSKRFPLKSTLKSHIYKIHTRERAENHLCTECGRTFAANCLLKKHMQTHSDERPISCSQCTSKFKDKVNLQSHMRVHSSERNFVCQVVVDGERVCGKKLQTAFSLRKHKKIHNRSLSDYRPFACKSCPAKFSKKDRLRIHTRIHTGERPFKCEHCDRAFKQKGDMTKHMLIHLGPTPHKCTECGESFRLETELRKHSYEHYKPPITK